MKANVGGFDKVLRIVIGIVLIAFSAMGIIGAWGMIGLLPLLTGVLNFCPAYAMFGMNTCPAESTEHHIHA